MYNICYKHSKMAWRKNINCCNPIKKCKSILSGSLGQGAVQRLRVLRNAILDVSNFNEEIKREFLPRSKRSHYQFMGGWG